MTRDAAQKRASDFARFHAALVKLLPPETRLISCQFRGDPFDDVVGKWRARVLNNPDSVDELANVYLCVSAMQRNERGQFRRKKENFAAGLLLMIDDLGTGPGAKFPLSLISQAPPTALIETSPDNFQAVYLFEKPEPDRAKFEALINAFIRQQFLDGKDPGMAGINRVFRPPIGVNGKAKYGGRFPVTLREWHPERRYSVEALAAAYSLDLTPPPQRLPRVPPGGVEFAIRQFERTLNELREAEMLKHDSPTADDWLSIVCPWVHEHTGSVDNGAAVRMPNPENGFHGGFKCHHGACEERGWRELTDWLADEQGDALELINRAAPAAWETKQEKW